MFTPEEIMKRLLAGEDLNAIAQEAADVLNAAKAQYDKAQAEKAAAAKRAEQLQKDKENAAGEIIDAIFNYMELFHPEVAEHVDEEQFYQDLDYKALVEALDAAVEATVEIQKAVDVGDMSELLANLAPDLDSVRFVTKKEDVPADAKPWSEAPKELRDQVDPILEFLAKNDLI